MEENAPSSHPVLLEGETPLDAAPLRTDSLADSVFLLLVLAVMQRAVGFFREILFCRWLDPEQLGQWDMAFGFLMLAAPLAVLSLPGTFGRYVERYRQQGQLPTFLRRSAIACSALALVAAVAITLAPGHVSQWIFGTADEVQIVLVLAASLLAVILFNYLTSLFTALRNIRVVTGMELSNGLLFAAIALVLLVTWQNSALSAVAAYGGACLLSSLGGLVCLRRTLPHQTNPSAASATEAMWSRVLPFALWILAINLLTNLFDVADRYMIIHCSSCSASEALAEVGNYRTSRVVPMLLASITVMIATVATPHLSHDWEAGHRDRVGARLNLLLKTWTVVLCLGGIVVLWGAPLLFQIALRGKFSGGQAVLPWTLVYCIWFGLAMIAQRYLWCAERAGLAGVALLVGLITNVGLNLLLLPRLGLLGAVLATAAANAAALALLMILSRWLGFQVHRGTWFLLPLPMVVCLGPWMATLALAAVGLEIVASDRLFTAEEKKELLAGAWAYVGRLRTGWASMAKGHAIVGGD